MKKLLILILSLVQAVSVHAMQYNRPMGLKDGNFQEAPKQPGIIQQRFLWSKPQPTHSQTAVNQQGGSNNQANIDQNNNNATSENEDLQSSHSQTAVNQQGGSSNQANIDQNNNNASSENEDLQSIHSQTAVNQQGGSSNQANIDQNNNNATIQTISNTEVSSASQNEDLGEDLDEYFQSICSQTANNQQDGPNNQANTNPIVIENENNATIQTISNTGTEQIVPSASRDEALSPDTSSNNTDDEDDYLPVIQINPADIRAGKQPAIQQMMMKNNPDTYGESSNQGAERMEQQQHKNENNSWYQNFIPEFFTQQQSIAQSMMSSFQIEAPEVEYEEITPESTPTQNPEIQDEDKTCACPTISFGDTQSQKHIGLICVHGTWSSNNGMGADANRLFSDALRKYAAKLASDNQAVVTMILPAWSGKLSTKERQEAAQNIDRTLQELNGQRLFDELHAIGHSHGCNVLLNLSLIARGSQEFNVSDKLKTMILIAPPMVEVDQFYTYPKNCITYIFHSDNDATRKAGTHWEQATSLFKILRNTLWSGVGRILPAPQANTGKAYNIAVEYLPETGMKPHHKSIKSVSLIDCLNTIEALISQIYENYYDLKLWITTDKGKYYPALALNDATKTDETDQSKIQLAEETSKNVHDHIPTVESQAIQATGYFLANLYREFLYKDPVLPTITNVSQSNNDDDEWSLVSKEETQIAISMRQIEEQLIAMVNLLPADLKQYIKIANLHKSANPIQELNSIRETLWLYITRADDNFAASYQDSLTKNFQPCGNFDPKQVYPYLGHTAETAKNMPNESFATLIATKLAAAESSNNEEEVWLMRQFGFLFRNELTKQAFDAYLSGSEELKNLKINLTETEKNNLFNRFAEILEIKGTLTKQLQNQTTNASSTMISDANALNNHNDFEIAHHASDSSDSTAENMHNSHMSGSSDTSSFVNVDNDDDDIFYDAQESSD